MRDASFDKFPFIAVKDAAHECVLGWEKIAAKLQEALANRRTEKPILVVECYPGVEEWMVLNELQSRLAPKLTIHTADAFHTRENIDKLVAPFLGQRRAAGPFRRLSLVNFFDAEPLWRFRRTIDELKNGLVLIVGCGASLIAWGDILVYADLARREARQRFRHMEHAEPGPEKSLPAMLKDNPSFLLDSGVADRWKRPLIQRWDYLLDTHHPTEVKLADAQDVRRGLHAIARCPFRVAFPPGQQLTGVCHRDGQANNTGRCFDHALEENSLILGFGDLRIEMSALNLIFNQAPALLGEAVYIRFGDEFPIRFDFFNQISRFEPPGGGQGWCEERATLQNGSALEIRRIRFRKTVTHDTHGGVNVWQLVEGEEAIVESPDRTFEPLVVRNGETFIIPAALRRYDIRPNGPSVGTEICTIKAFVRL